MQKIKEALQRFMYGRYGVDTLGRHMMYAFIILWLVSLLTDVKILNTLALILIILCYFRMLSKNYAKRSAENTAYLQWYNKVRQKFTTKKSEAEDKTHRYYRCSQCKQRIRVPRGKGKIQITCPKCKNTFIKRT